MEGIILRGVVDIIGTRQVWLNAEGIGMLDAMITSLITEVFVIPEATSHVTKAGTSVISCLRNA